MDKIKVVTVGGGSGGYVVDKGLVNYFKNLTSITTCFDSGGSSGILKDELGVLPPGDLRRRILAQAHNNTHILRELFNFRFQESDKNLANHNLGNLILTGAEKIWGKEAGIDMIAKLFQVVGQVLPVSLGKADLKITFNNGKILYGEKELDNFENAKFGGVQKIELDKKVFITERVRQALLEADYIIFCPGDFYASLLSNLLVGDFVETVNKSKAKTIFISNLMTKSIDTPHFKLSNYIETLESVLGKNLDCILFNKTKISTKLLHKYFKEEGAELVVNDTNNAVKLKNNKTRRIIECNLINESGTIIRHDPLLVASEVIKITQS